MTPCSKITTCKRCPLSKVQGPILDTRKDPDVMWVGLSAKLISRNYARPLDERTMSGKLITDIEKLLPDLSFYSTNLVKCPPVKGDGKLRYPTPQEAQACIPNLMLEIASLKPKVVVSLGGRVAEAMGNALSVTFFKGEYPYVRSMSCVDGICYISIAHPSYVSVYKRKDIRIYCNEVTQVIERIVTEL